MRCSHKCDVDMKQIWHKMMQGQLNGSNYGGMAAGVNFLANRWPLIENSGHQKLAMGKLTLENMWTLRFQCWNFNIFETKRCRITTG
eukprot:Gb_07791 [translate_table: standard]